MAEKKQVYNAVYADGSYGKVTLGKLINKGGASGKIYLVEGRPESVVKIFHHTEKSASNRQKLQAMLLNKPNFHIIPKNRPPTGKSFRPCCLTSQTFNR